MPRPSSARPSKVQFNTAVPVTATRPRFVLSTAFVDIDAARISARANVEVEVGKFEGEGCGRTVTAVVQKGKVKQLKVSPCADTIPMANDPKLKALMRLALRRLGEPTPTKFKQIAFAAFQQQAGPITVKTITCVQICIFGHCFVCCTLPQGGFFCGSRIVIHTP